jgi:hypothetical protein
MTVALLRAVGVPARARCGFGTHFRPGWFEDHWIAEVWNPDGDRWVMVDAQLDDTWRRYVDFAGDPLAITPTEFVTAGHAWQAWRRGELDADRCGLSAVGEHGAFWIAGNLRLDLASLNKVEMLPWDVWGAGLEPGTDRPRSSSSCSTRSPRSPSNRTTTFPIFSTATTTTGYGWTAPSSTSCTAGSRPSNSSCGY